MAVNGRSDGGFPPPRFRFDWTLNISSLVTIAAIVLGAVMAWSRVDQRLSMVETIERQTNRMEHYLESKDPDYWKQAAQNGDR